jgi:hypothetical protein
LRLEPLPGTCNNGMVEYRNVVSRREFLIYQLLCQEGF